MGSNERKKSRVKWSGSYVTHPAYLAWQRNRNRAFALLLEAVKGAPNPASPPHPTGRGGNKSS